MRASASTLTMTLIVRTLAAASKTSGFSNWRRAKASNCRVSFVAIGRVGDRIDVALALFVGTAGSAQQIDRTTDHRQQVVEVVCHPAGKLTDRFYLLRLTRGVLGLHEFARHALTLFASLPPARKLQPSKKGSSFGNASALLNQSRV
jgi:hypothetical protein